MRESDVAKCPRCAGLYDRCQCPLSAEQGGPITMADEMDRLVVNSEPLQLVSRCRQCHKRAPWCSCGAMDYET